MSENENIPAPENAENTTATAEEESTAAAHEHEHDHDHDHAHTHAADEDEFQFVEDPEYDIDYKGDCLYEVQVKVPPANQQKQTSEIFDELAGEAQVPGFRKGKAPRKLLENKFGKIVRGEATEKIVAASWRRLLEQEEYRPLEFPKIEGLEDIQKADETEPLSFKLVFEVMPRVTLGDYKGLEVERPVLQVDEQAVDAALKDIRDRFATYETVEDGQAQEEDQVIIDFKGVIDGEEFAGGSAENYPYVLGSGRFFGEFEEALKGASAGAEVACDVTFPDDYSAAHLAGKTANFTIKVNEIKRKKLPELDDDFAQQVGMEGIDQLRDKVRNDLREGAAEQSRRIAETNAVQQIVEKSEFELPKSLVDDSAEQYYQQEVRRLMQVRVPLAEIESKDEAIREQAHEDAVRNIKGFVAINEIGHQEEIQVTEEDLEREAEQIQQRTGMEMEVVHRFLAQSDQRDSYASRIFRQKAMELVMEHAQINEKEVTREELNEQDEQETA